MSGGETQEQILDAVQSVIVRDGVRGASMRQVAQEADVSVGLLSYHFDDKDTLILAAFERATSRLFAASLEAADRAEAPSDKVRAFLRGSFTDEFLDGDYLKLRISLWAVALTDDGVAELEARFFDQYTGALRELLAGARPDLSAAEIANRTVDAVAFTNGIWLNWARFGGATDLERGLQHAEALILDGR